MKKKKKRKIAETITPTDLFQELKTVNYINLNGKILEAEQAPIYTTNRSFRYGDAVFETIRIADGKIMFLKDHIKRLLHSMRVLKMEVRQEFTASILGQQMADLAIKNNVTANGRIRLSIFRNQDGYYTPETNAVSHLIEVEKIDKQGFLLNTKGITIDVFPDFKKPHNQLSNIKSANALIYVLAGIYKTEKKLGDCFILNESENISETISSNVFAVKNKHIYTPALSQGCVDGIMRKNILKLAQENDFAISEIKLTPDFLLNADEIFLTNCIQGIRWVGAFKNSRYYNKVAKHLSEKLNKLS